MGEYGTYAAHEDVQIAADENQLEKAILSCLQDGDAILICGGRKMQFSITARRIFGITDGFIPDAW